MQYDVIVIGGGPGGYSCAVHCAQHGLRTALVERDLLGGTCLNRGCIPTKAVLHAAQLLRQAQQADRFGIQVQGAWPDFPALRARCRAVTDELRRGVQMLLEQNNVTVYAGTGYVQAPQQVRVTPDGGKPVVLHGTDIVLATGSVPAVPPIPGAEQEGIYTSDSFLAELPALHRLTIIGGGVIGMELADAYAAFGTEVTVVEAAPRILPSMDRELVQQLTMLLKKRGVRFVTGAAVTQIDSNYTCTCSTKTGSITLPAEGVLLAVGRRTMLQNQCAPDCTPTCDHGRVRTDANGASDVPHLYVIGDAAAGMPQLAHAAEAQAKITAAHLSGTRCGIDRTVVPACVYTSPEIAAVGWTDRALKEAEGAAFSGKALMRANGKSVILDEPGFIKLVADGDGVLRGAQLFCAHATELIGEAALAIAQRTTLRAFAEQVRAHPSLEEAYGAAAQAALRACERQR